MTSIAYQINDVRHASENLWTRDFDSDSSSVYRQNYPYLGIIYASK